MVRYIDINKQGYSIKCKLFCQSLRDNEKVIVYCHGFGGHKDTKSADHFAEAVFAKMKKTAVLIFDWPAHGKDVRKKISLDDCDTYLSMVLEYVKEEMKAETIFAYGMSFGGYMILKYIHDHSFNPFSKIALRSTAVTMGMTIYNRIMTDENRELLGKGKDVQTGFDRKVLIDRSFLEQSIAADIREYEYLDYADDIFMVHGGKDELIPLAESRGFAENNVIEFMEIEGADHRFQDLNKMKLAHSKMIEFYME